MGDNARLASQPGARGVSTDGLGVCDHPVGETIDGGEGRRFAEMEDKGVIQPPELVAIPDVRQARHLCPKSAERDGDGVRHDDIGPESAQESAHRHEINEVSDSGRDCPPAQLCTRKLV